MQQLTFQLTPQNPFSLHYFVEHTGVTAALSALRKAIESSAREVTPWVLFCVSGPKGAGKTHLIHGVIAEAEERGFPQEKFSVFDLQDAFELTPDARKRYVSNFVSQYEERRVSGGICIVETHDDLDLGSELAPHLLSRLSAGIQLRIDYPREIELRPMLAALQERRNLRLSEQNIEYLLRWLPANPLSFESILAALDELSLIEKKSAGRKMIREVLRESVLLRERG